MVAAMSDSSVAVGVDRRRERSRRTRQRIVETAYGLFVARGYSVPLADVADAAAVSVQNLYVAF
jgi:AcrR family transcriptional regulator